MGLYILDSGLAPAGTATESKPGLTEPSTKASGKIARPADTENSGMLKAISSKAPGWKIKLMGKESTLTSTGQGLKGSGKMTFRTVSELKPGQMGADIRASTSRAASTGSECMYGMMEVCLLGSGMRTKSMEEECTPGSMGGSMTENGSTTTCTAMEFMYGKMDASTRESTDSTKSMGRVPMCGLMVGSISEAGETANSTEKEFKSALMELHERDCGRTGNA